MKLLILGNGFEINFNENLKNFNENFKDWIINHDTDDKIFDLYDDIMKISKRDTISNPFEEKHLVKCIKQLIHRIKDKKEYILETELFLLGKEYTEKINESGNSKIGEEIFYCFKAILGYYIFIKTINECDSLKYETMNFLESEEPPEIIFTTNYTDSADTLKNEWENRYLFPTTSEIKVENIHGKFNNKEPNKQIFLNLEINLNEKNSWKSFEAIYLDNKIKKINIEIFGLNMDNDENLMLSLIRLGKTKEIKINYFFKELEDINSVINSLTKIINKKYTYSNKTKYYIEEINFQLADDNDKFVNIANLNESKILENKFLLLKIVESNDNDGWFQTTFELNLNFIPTEENFLYKGFKTIELS